MRGGEKDRKRKRAREREKREFQLHCRPQCNRMTIMLHDQHTLKFRPNDFLCRMI